MTRSMILFTYLSCLLSISSCSNSIDKTDLTEVGDSRAKLIYKPSNPLVVEGITDITNNFRDLNLKFCRLASNQDYLYIFDMKKRIITTYNPSDMTIVNRIDSPTDFTSSFDADKNGSLYLVNDQHICIINGSDIKKYSNQYYIDYLSGSPELMSGIATIRNRLSYLVIFDTKLNMIKKVQIKEASPLPEMQTFRYNIQQLGKITYILYTLENRMLTYERDFTSSVFVNDPIMNLKELYNIKALEKFIKSPSAPVKFAELADTSLKLKKINDYIYTFIPNYPLEDINIKLLNEDIVISFRCNTNSQYYVQDYCLLFGGNRYSLIVRVRDREVENYLLLQSPWFSL
jgi:hypothetical protein